MLSVHLSPSHVVRLLLIAARNAGTLRGLGDLPGHEFHGNQWAAGTVLCKDGTPLTLYHGSTAKGMTRQTLDPNAARVRPATTPTGIAFTSDERAAHGYARSPGKASEGGGKFGSVVKANLVMHNPLDITKDVKTWQKQGKSFGDAKREALKKLTAAHDGMIFRGDRVNNDEYVAFSSHQIREPHVRSVKALGDLPGHEFHGNQWAAGSGSIADKHGLSYQVRHSTDYTGRKVYSVVHPEHNDAPEGAWTIATVTLRREEKAASHVSVDSHFGRRGIATALYQHIEQHLGHKLEPNAALTDEGKAFWKSRSLSRHHESAIHRAADAHVAKLSVAFRYAFAMGRRALGKPPNVKRAVTAIRTALEDVLPPTLRKAVAAGGDAGLLMLRKRLRTAGDVDGHEFHGNQWTDGSSTADAKTVAVFVDRKGAKEDVNSRLRDSPDLLSDQAYEHVDAMDKIMDRSRTDRDMVVHRVMPDELGHLSAGDTFVDKGFVSTSKSAADLERVKGDIHHDGPTTTIVISVPKGSRAVDVNKALGTEHKYAHQNEVLLDRNQTFRVDRVKRNEETDQHEYHVTLLKSRTAGDVAGHEFHGNQWANISATPHSSGRIDATIEHRGTIGVHEYVKGSSHAEAQVEKDGSVTLMRLHTDQENRGRGVATALINRVRAEAGEHVVKTSGVFSPGGTAVLDSFVRKGEADKTQDGNYVFKKLRTAKDTPKAVLNISFDATNQHVIDWADRHAAESITNVTETSREAINNAVAEHQETGDWNEYYDEILAAVGDEDRADLIARHESMLAAGEGQRQGWDQAVDAGLLTGDEERVWIVTGDEKVCPICEGLEDARAKLGEPYTGDDGEEYDGPPAHVQCRCTEGIA